MIRSPAGDRRAAEPYRAMAYNNAWANHRGQAHAMLSGTDAPPPQLDEFFSAGEAPLRAGDFAELGWTEALIWGA